MLPASTKDIHRSLWIFLGPLSFVILSIGLGMGISRSGPSKDALTTAQLAKALNLHYWVYTVPQHEEGAFLKFELVDGEKVRYFGGSGGISAGEKLLVTLRSVPGSIGKFEGSVQGPKFDFHVVIDAPVFVGLMARHYTPDGLSINQEPLVLANHSGTISLPFTGNRDGDVFLRVVMVKNKE